MTVYPRTYLKAAASAAELSKPMGRKIGALSLHFDAFHAFGPSFWWSWRGLVLCLIAVGATWCDLGCSGGLEGVKLRSYAGGSAILLGSGGPWGARWEAPGPEI